MRIVLLLLQLTAVNLLYADQVQTHFWSAGTWRNPIELAAGISVAEVNPILAGHPERVDTYFGVLKSAAAAAPFILSTDKALLYLTGTVIAEGLAVWHNARTLRRAGVSWRLSLSALPD